jgi:hypothetical protein
VAKGSETRRLISSDEVLQEEIVAEKANALGRIARQLEDYLAELQLLRQEISAGVDRYERYERTRKQAELYFWYLTVQRECMGIYDNAALARAYPIPGPLRPGER